MKSSLSCFSARKALRLGGVCAALAAVLVLAVSCRTAAPEIDLDLDLPQTSQTYLLRVGDIVQVDVFQEPVMTTRQRVQGDGTISVGLIGRVAVLGESVEVAADKIAKLLDKKYLVDPQVSVTVLAYSPRRYTVWGQVQRPGSYVIPPEQNVSLPEAIATAGGNSDIGNLKQVVVSRKKNGEIVRMRLNALAPQSQTFLIHEGDVIFVKETIF
ncbi:MAG: polysaccharide biosynthesis/export family protein [Terrimicrobiaceae bacterium]